MKTMIILTLALAAAPATQAAPRPSWTTLADCAGAYRANSQIKDPSRPATMVRDMADVGEDYAKAARTAYALKPSAKATDPQKAVESRVADQAARFAKRPRAQIEKFIETCPQPED